MSPSDDESSVPNSEKGKERTQPLTPGEVPGWASDPENDGEFTRDTSALRVGPTRVGTEGRDAEGDSMSKLNPPKRKIDSRQSNILQVVDAMLVLSQVLGAPVGDRIGISKKISTLLAGNLRMKSVQTPNLVGPREVSLNHDAGYASVGEAMVGSSDVGSPYFS